MSTGTERTGFGPDDCGRAGMEQRLRTQMDQAQVRLRPELAREAYRAHRRHRAVRRSVAAAGTAVVIAAGIALAATGATPFSVRPVQQPGPSGTPTSAPDGAIVPAPIMPIHPAPAPSDSLTAQQAAQDILVTSGTTMTGPSDAFTVVDTYTYKDTTRAITYEPAPNGRDPWLDVLTSTTDGTTTVTRVNYASRTWSRQASAAPLQPAITCATLARAGWLGLDLSRHPDVARSLLSCPSPQLDHGKSVNGIRNILIATPNVGLLWINATTYLPYEFDAYGMETQLQYLPPTRANLAALDFAIPVGFRQATPASTVPPGPPVPQPWTPPAGAIPPFGLQPVPAGNGLTAAEAKGDILWARSTTEAVPASDTLVDNIFSYESASRDLTYYPDGKPWDDDSEAVIRGAGGTLTSTHTVVLYDKRTYSVQSSPGASSAPVQQPSCTAGLDLNFQVTPDAASALLGCPNLKVTRGQRIDGIGAITIAAKDGTETLWINATTHLPIQLTIVNPTGHWPPAGYDSAKSPGQVEQFSWLPPTPANQSYLASPVPAGFTKS